MRERRLDLLVISSVVLVVLAGGVINLLAPPSPNNSILVKDLGEQIAVGMSLGQVWGIWGTPDVAEWNQGAKIVTYTWQTPHRQVVLSTSTPVWRVLSFLGYTEGG